MNHYPCAVCGAESTATVVEVPLCAEHGEVVRQVLAQKTKELNDMARKAKTLLMDHLRATLAEGKLPL